MYKLSFLIRKFLATKRRVELGNTLMISIVENFMIFYEVLDLINLFVEF